MTFVLKYLNICINKKIMKQMDQRKTIIWFLGAEPEIQEFLIGYFHDFDNYTVKHEDVSTYTLGGFNKQTAEFLYRLAKENSASIITIDKNISCGLNSKYSANGIINEFKKLPRKLRGVTSIKPIKIFAINPPNKRRRTSCQILRYQICNSLC